MSYHRDIVLPPMSEEQKRYIKAEDIKARDRLLVLQAKELESRERLKLPIDQRSPSS